MRRLSEFAFIRRLVGQLGEQGETGCRFLGIEWNTKKFVEDDLTPWIARNMGELIGVVPEWQALNRVLSAVLD